MDMRLTNVPVYYKLSPGAPCTNIMIVVTITGIFMAINHLLIYTLGFLYIGNSGSVNA